MFAVAFYALACLSLPCRLVPLSPSTVVGRKREETAVDNQPAGVPAHTRTQTLEIKR